MRTQYQTTTNSNGRGKQCGEYRDLIGCVKVTSANRNTHKAAVCGVYQTINTMRTRSAPAVALEWSPFLNDCCYNF